MRRNAVLIALASIGIIILLILAPTSGRQRSSGKVFNPLFAAGASAPPAGRPGLAGAVSTAAANG
jgi:hypothetical protein